MRGGRRQQWRSRTGPEDLKQHLQEHERMHAQFHARWGHHPPPWARWHWQRAHLRRRILLSLVGAGIFWGLVLALLWRVIPPGFGFRAVAVGVGCMVGLSMVSAVMAKRLARPLEDVTRLANELAAGNLSARIATPTHRHRDLDALDLRESLNRMADRIETQMNDQRALLTAVSHEIRTPLARMRILAELARGGDQGALDKLDREILEADALVGDLLAGSRMDFGALKKTELRAAELATRAMENAEAPIDRLHVVSDATFAGDATLVLRALVNLIENAERHGGGLVELRVTADGGVVRFEAEDDGPGFVPGTEQSVFEPFRAGGERPGSIGVGLSLVGRIAKAHGGTARAGSRAPVKGARVTLELPRA